jgi:hypothetical protein
MHKPSIIKQILINWYQDNDSPYCDIKTIRSLNNCTVDQI